MTTQSTQLADAAQLLHDAQTSGIPISPLTQTYPNLDVAQAYSVQRLNLARYIDGGAVLRGHKIGLTSAPMQELLGVNEPDFGYILDSMVLPNGAAVSVTAFCAPRVEPEAAFTDAGTAAGAWRDRRGCHGGHRGGGSGTGDRGQPNRQLAHHAGRHDRRQCQLRSGGAGEVGADLAGAVTARRQRQPGCERHDGWHRPGEGRDGPSGPRPLRGWPTHWPNSTPASRPANSSWPVPTPLRRSWWPATQRRPRSAVSALSMSVFSSPRGGMWGSSRSSSRCCSGCSCTGTPTRWSFDQSDVSIRITPRSRAWSARRGQAAVDGRSPRPRRQASRT